MEVTPMMIYLIGVAGNVRAFSVVSLLIIIAIFLVFLARYLADGDKIPHLGTLIFSAALFSSLLIFIPNSKTLAAMYVIPAVVNNEQIQNISKNGLESLDLLTKQWVDELREEKSKKDD